MGSQGKGMKLFPPDDPKQALRLRRTLLAQAGGVVCTLLCAIAVGLGYFRGGWRTFLIILSLAWGVHLVLLGVIRSGLNKRFKDPSLTLAQITWATLAVLGMVYFMDQLRMVVLMYYLLVMFFGAFRVMAWGFAYITTLAVAGYGVVIWLLVRFHPEVVNLRVELVRWLGFAISMACFSLVGTELSRLRRRVSHQNRDLREALATISELAITDELTGLYNRRHILSVLEYQKMLADRGGHSFVLAFADLDHFKQVNDRYGHHAGDQVLKRFAQIARISTREVDYLARFGGEEFVLVLVQTSLPRALTVAERIRSQVEEGPFVVEGAEIRLTVSLGLTEYQVGEEVEATLARADEALYRAKQKGRNRVEVHLGGTTGDGATGDGATGDGTTGDGTTGEGGTGEGGTGGDEVGGARLPNQVVP